MPSGPPILRRIPLILSGYFGAYCKRINKENIRFYRVNMLPSKNPIKTQGNNEMPSFLRIL